MEDDEKVGEEEESVEVVPEIDPEFEPVATEEEDDDPESQMGEEVEP
jgi:hypothetical protein